MRNQGTRERKWEGKMPTFKAIGELVSQDGRVVTQGTKARLEVAMRRYQPFYEALTIRVTKVASIH